MLDNRRNYGAGISAVTISALLTTIAPTAARSESAQQIRAAAESYARQALANSAFPIYARSVGLDDRLTLPDCPGKTSASLPAGANWGERTLVQLRCDDGIHWSVMVPIHIESEMPVLVLRAASARGANLQTSDVSKETRRVPGISADYVNSTAQLMRQHLRRPLGAGSVLRVMDLEGDALVHRGELVSVVSETRGMRIQVEAVALADARSGERVRLQNRGSLKLLDGVVDTDGTVRVQP